LTGEKRYGRESVQRRKMDFVNLYGYYFSGQIYEPMGLFVPMI
jgi:hypothetical protein